LLAAFGLAGVTGCAHHGADATASPAARATALAGNQRRGAEVFRANCAVCHAANGAAAGVGPLLVDEKQRKTYAQTVAWIEQPDPPMPKLYPAPLN
jgi:mono/diheme cytochrome c family protein